MARCAAPTASRPSILPAALLAGLAVAALACDGATGPGGCSDRAGRLTFETADPLVLERLRGGELVVASGEDGCGDPVAVSPGAVTWTSSDPAVASLEVVDGAMEPTAWVVAGSFGTATITAAAGEATGDLAVEVRRPDTEASAFTVIGSGAVGPYTTDLWVHGSHVYSGSQPWSCDGPCEARTGWLYVWRIQADGGIARVDSLSLPGARINDIKVSADGALAVASQELGGPGKNGIVVLDLADPAAPAIAAIHTAGLENGVHNVWIERIAGRDYVFTVEEGGPAESAGLHVIDVTDPAAPVDVAVYQAGDSFPHDVYVRDGLAFLSHWDAGLVILDVGNGMAGGSPADPVEVSRIVTDGGHVHNAWYWPAGQVVFVGEERFPPPDRIDEVGVLHVVDVSDMTAPVEVATYGVPGSSPHNFWLDEDRGILFAAWYTNGLRALDVSGTLAGDLAAQGRELGHVVPSGPRGAASIWAPQLHGGLVYLSDIFNGLWAVRFDG